jgi:phosphoribosylformylglycinamidine synthase PurS subunit
MKFKAQVTIMPLEALLDPQGKAVSSSMTNIGLPEITGVRVGKHLTMEVEAKDEKVAAKKVEEACEKLLCNAIMEQYSYSLSAEGKK